MVCELVNLLKVDMIFKINIIIIKKFIIYDRIRWQSKNPLYYKGMDYFLITNIEFNFYPSHGQPIKVHGIIQSQPH